MRPFGNETGCAILSAFRGRTGGGIFYACKNIYIDHPAPTISNRRICNGAPSIVRAPSLMPEELSSPFNRIITGLSTDFGSTICIDLEN
jgi:hypothetical protein